MRTRWAILIVFFMYIVGFYIGTLVSDATWHNGIPAKWERKYETISDSSHYLGGYILINDSITIEAEFDKRGYDKLIVFLNGNKTPVGTYTSIFDNTDDAVWYLGGKYDDYMQNNDNKFAFD